MCQVGTRMKKIIHCNLIIPHFTTSFPCFIACRIPQRNSISFQPLSIQNTNFQRFTHRIALRYLLFSKTLLQFYLPPEIQTAFGFQLGRNFKNPKLLLIFSFKKHMKEELCCNLYLSQIQPHKFQQLFVLYNIFTASVGRKICSPLYYGKSISKEYLVHSEIIYFKKDFEEKLNEYNYLQSERLLIVHQQRVNLL